MKITVWVLSTCLPSDGKPCIPELFTTEATAMARFDQLMREEWEVHAPPVFACEACGCASDEEFEECPECGVTDQCCEMDRKLEYPGDPTRAHDMIDACRDKQERADGLSEVWGRYNLTGHEIELSPAARPPQQPAPKEILEVARKVHQTDDLEIDDDAAVSAATDGGSWVQAWVYLSNETLDEHDVPHAEQSSPETTDGALV